MIIFRFIKAILRYVFFGTDLPDTEINYRRSICGSCEYNIDRRCSQCGCFIKYKTRMSTEECPENKW